MQCPHPTLRRAAGGRCPICDADAAAERRQVEEHERRQEREAAALAAIEDGERARAELARRYLSYFVRAAWHVLEPEVVLEWSWHHDVICRHVQYVLDEWRWRRRHPHAPSVMQNLCANICPGSAKSRILSVSTPSWMWLDSPGWRVNCVSSNDAVVARDHGLMAKLVKSDWYRTAFRPGWSIENDSAKFGLRNTAGGVRLSRTFLSGAVGLRADCNLFDDLDDPGRVKSAAYRGERDEKWGSAWFNRVNDDRVSTRICSQQRVYHLDHTALILGQGGDEGDDGDEDLKADWAHLCIPLHWRVGLPETPIGTGDPRTEVGQVMHPDRFTPRVIRLLKRALGDAAFDLQYDQRSSPKDARFFQRDWWRFYQRSTEVLSGHRTAPPMARPEGCTDRHAELLGARSILRGGQPVMTDDLDEVIGSVDASHGAARKDSRGGDKSSRDGLGVIGKRGKRRWVLDDRTEQRTYPQLKDAIVQLIEDYPDMSLILVERKANGAAVIQDLDGDTALRGVKLEPVDPEESKVGRATAHTPAIRDGKLLLLDGAAWVPAFVDEHASYEGRDGDKSDRVDWLSQALRYWTTKAGGGSGGRLWWMEEEELEELAEAGFDLR